MNTVQPMTDSPIKWVGGKSKLRAEVIARLPALAECYAEVFAGAGWVLFGKPRHAVEVLNDANDDLVNLWRVLKWRPAELLEEVHKHLYSRTMHSELKTMRPDKWDEMTRAVWLYLLIQMSYGADVQKPETASFGFRNKSRGDLFLKKSLHQFEPAQERLQGVFIESLDFEDCIRRYDQPRSIFFCDPPYLETCGYAVDFSLPDHERLAKCLKAIEGKFLLTINDHALIRELYAGCHIEEATEVRALARASEGRQAAPILFVANYDMREVAGVGSMTSAFDFGEPSDG